MLQEGLGRLGIATPQDPRGVPVASRTDRGVSAVGNALLLTSPLPPGDLLRALNGVAPEMFFTHAAPAPSNWNVRAAESRVYRFFEVGPPTVGDRYREWAQRLVGRIDVRSFGRKVPGSVPLWREVTGVTIGRDPEVIEIEIRAPSFVWGMVRKMVSALRALEAGRLTAAELSRALEGHRRLALPLAEPEPLVLWDVQYPFPWTHRCARFTRHQTRYWTAERRAWRARGPILAGLADAATASHGAPRTGSK
ncbi:MAG: hypothetical protein L3K19_03130 [Thermoplasmata archaeon]|nr:hypothetical protein [Thermoplasmata archaeon]